MRHRNTSIAGASCAPRFLYQSALNQESRAGSCSKACSNAAMWASTAVKRCSREPVALRYRMADMKLYASWQRNLFFSFRRICSSQALVTWNVQSSTLKAGPKTPLRHECEDGQFQSCLHQCSLPVPRCRLGTRRTTSHQAATEAVLHGTSSCLLNEART